MKKGVIIGGGFAGSIIAKKLERYFSITLIDTKDYFEFTPGVLRVIARPDENGKIQVLHKEYLKKAEVVVGKVGDVNDKQVTVGKRKIGYDYLVVASGSSYKAPFKHSRLHSNLRARELAGYSAQLKRAKNVLIIGGGLVGVELAGEIAHYLPEIKITLVELGSELLGRMPLAAREHAKFYLESKGAEIVLNEKVVKHIDNAFVTDKGRRISAELGFVCTGINPNSSFLGKHFAGLLDERGFASVDEFLRLKEHENIFIAGDLTNIREEKTAQNAERHAQIIVQNIINSDCGKLLDKYEPRKNPVVISLGPRNGIFINGEFVLNGIIPAFLKWLVEKKEMLKKKL